MAQFVAAVLDGKKLRSLPQNSCRCFCPQRPLVISRATSGFRKAALIGGRRFSFDEGRSDSDSDCFFSVECGRGFSDNTPKRNRHGKKKAQGRASSGGQGPDEFSRLFDTSDSRRLFVEGDVGDYVDDDVVSLFRGGRGDVDGDVTAGMEGDILSMLLGDDDEDDDATGHDVDTIDVTSTVTVLDEEKDHQAGPSKTPTTTTTTTTSTAAGQSTSSESANANAHTPMRGATSVVADKAIHQDEDEEEEDEGGTLVRLVYDEDGRMERLESRLPVRELLAQAVETEGWKEQFVDVSMAITPEIAESKTDLAKWVGSFRDKMLAEFEGVIARNSPARPSRELLHYAATWTTGQIMEQVGDLAKRARDLS